MAYSEEQQAFIFDIWAMAGDRNAEKTARLVREHDDAAALGISDITSRTIRNWANDPALMWQDRAYRLIYAVAPELRFQAQSTLALASPEAAEVMRQAINTDCMVERHFVVKNADGSTEVESRMEFDVNIFKAKVNAAQLLLDRTGFSPVGTRETGVLDPPPSKVTDILEQVRTITDPDALRELEVQLLGELGLGSRQIGIGQSFMRSTDRKAHEAG